MTRKTLLVLTVVCLALSAGGFAATAGAAHVSADDGGTASQGCDNGPQPLCGGGGGGDGGGGGGDCGAGPEPFCS